MAGLAPTFGRGAMTNHWVDIKNADVVMVMGGNPAEAHPCGFKWVVEAKANNKAKLIVVDPRFTRTAAVADVYAQIRPGTDIAFLGGVIRYLLEKDKIQHEYVDAYTNASFLVKRGTTGSRTASSPATTTRRSTYDKLDLELRARQGRLREGRPDPAGSALRVPADEEALRALHAEDGQRTSPASPEDSS